MALKGKSFVVRIEEDSLKEFNDILKRKSINRSELFRKWIRDYIEKEEERENGLK